MASLEIGSFQEVETYVSWSVAVDVVVLDTVSGFRQ